MVCIHHPLVLLGDAPGSTHVGMALSEDGRFCVANYFPAGNAQSPINRSALINLTSEQVERGESVCGTLCPAKIDRTKMTKDIGTAREPLVWLATVSLRPWVCTFVSVFGGYWC